MRHPLFVGRTRRSISLLSIGLMGGLLIAFSAPIPVRAADQGLPFIEVRGNGPGMHGRNWGGSESVTVRIDEEGAETRTWAGVPVDGGEFQLSALEEGGPQFHPGQTITVLGSDGTTKVLVVPELGAVTRIDFDADVVGGNEASPGVIEVDFEVLYGDGTYALGERWAVPDEDGSWTVNFAEGEPAVDLARAPYAELMVKRTDDDGDTFTHQWGLQEQSPRGFQVYGDVMDPDPPDWAWLGGWGFAGATTVSAFDPITQASAEWTFTTPYPWGWFGQFDIASEWDVRPGQTLTVIDATGEAKTVLFPGLAVTAADPGADTISGLCDPVPGTPVGVTPWDEPWPTLTATCEPAGTFEADFSGVFDIQPGDQLQAVQDDGDGDQPAVHWRVPLIAFEFSGFLAPVDNLPTFNRAKAGQAVPVKFSLSGDQGLNIFAAGYPVSQQLACESGAPIDTIEQTVAVGSSSLSYDALSDTYTYVWKTNKAWAGTCRQLVVRLADGTDHVAKFQLK